MPSIQVIWNQLIENFTNFITKNVYSNLDIIFETKKDKKKILW